MWSNYDEMTCRCHRENEGEGVWWRDGGGIIEEDEAAILITGYKL